MQIILFILMRSKLILIFLILIRGLDAYFSLLMTWDICMHILEGMKKNFLPLPVKAVVSQNDWSHKEAEIIQKQ